jgi:outer membrane protein OmpA-like peptidoglycan-associated protein
MGGRINTQVQTQTATTTRTTTTPTLTQAQIDSVQQENEKLKELAAKNMKKEGVEKPKEPKPTKNAKKAKRKQEAYEKESRQYEKALAEEMRKTRKQQAYSSAALVGAVSANAIVSGNNNKPAKPAIPDTVIKKDTVIVEKFRTDTVFVRDTIRIGGTTTPVIKVDPKITTTVLPEAHVYFASGSAVLGTSYKQVLSKAATWMINNPGKRVLLTGVTDATGSPSFNRQLAEKRIAAVENELKRKGVDTRMLDKKVQVSSTKSKTASASNRRVDLSVVE